MAIQRSSSIITGLSTDAKPTDVPTGIVFFEIDTVIRYVWTGTAWQSLATAGPQGPKGDKGDTGGQGIQGPAGSDGAQGPQGVGTQGVKGDTGDVGPRGFKGEKGDKGDAGVNAPAILPASLIAMWRPQSARVAKRQYTTLIHGR